MDTPAEILKKPYARLIVPETDGTYRAEIAEFPGCIASGDTAAGALASLEEVAEGWLTAVTARGQPVPEPVENLEFSGKLVLRLAKSLHATATYAAKRDGISLNQYIVTALAMYVGQGTQADTGRQVATMSLPQGFEVVQLIVSRQCDQIVQASTALGAAFGKPFAPIWENMSISTGIRTPHN